MYPNLQDGQSLTIALLSNIEDNTKDVSHTLLRVTPVTSMDGSVYRIQDVSVLVTKCP